MSNEQGGGSDGALSFDLTTRPWLPVQLNTGEEQLLSLREIFSRADEVRRLAGDLPTQDFALTRLLLAILHDAVDGPQDTEAWAELWEDDAPFADVADYLAEQRSRFDLLHPRMPFFQTGGLHTASGEVFSLNRMVADVPNGDPFFTTRFPGAERLSFAEAARWVVHAQAYDTSGIKTGVVGDPRVKGGKAYPQGVAWAGNLGGVLAEGTTLRETLLLNLVVANQQPTDAADLPAWRRLPTGPGAADDLSPRPAGLRDLYTWQSRRLLLHADADGVHGVVLTYGDPLAVQNMHSVEPMTGWRRSQAQEKKLSLPLVYMPREHDPARAAWRGMEALVAPRDPDTARRGEPASGLRSGIVDWIARLQAERILPRGRHIRVRTFGAVYGTQQSVIDEVTSDAVSLAVLLLSDTDRALGQAAVDAVADADRAVLALGDLAFDLARAAGSESEFGKHAARDAAYAALDGPYRLWLDAIGEGDDPQQLRTAWQRTARLIVARLADDVINAAGETAWQGRLVSSAKGETWLNADLADLWFRSRLSKALPMAADTGEAAVPAQHVPDLAGAQEDATTSSQKVSA
ncbi:MULTISPECIES: type I-E CRISPR-associated protein Cse1/CasA [unclassified Streptomyces]|uniref:type I-E CRISPR-associated protein Cse1/CasA n=1 Tax=unclassified Streptomyces TaxID=2593676 RepID=UPI001F17CFFB|nr:type I-E CRISPR-associated protein Cse1/CasA [Streptomyces sp. BoleA5]